MNPPRYRAAERQHTTPGATRAYRTGQKRAEHRWQIGVRSRQKLAYLNRNRPNGTAPRQHEETP